MEKRKRWQQVLILGVLFLTVYNILPTLFFYSKPLKQQIDAPYGAKIISNIVKRTTQVEKETEEWLFAFCKLLHINPQSIALSSEDPHHISVIFKNLEDAQQFRKYLPRAGALISFPPKQLSLFNAKDTSSKTVLVQRKIPIQFAEETSQNYFQFATKFDESKYPTPAYRSLVFDRALQLALAIGGVHENTKFLQTAIAHKDTNSEVNQDLLLKVCQNIVSFTNNFNENDPIAKRYFASFSQTASSHQKSELIQNFINTLEQCKDDFKLKRISLQSEAQSLQTKGEFLETSKQQLLEQLLIQEKLFLQAATIFKKHKALFAGGKTPWNRPALNQKIEESFALAQNLNSTIQTISFEGRNPFIEALIVNWSSETIELKLYPDFIQFQEKIQTKASLKEQTQQFLYNEIAHHSHQSGEKIVPFENHFQVHLNQLEGSNSFLTLRLAPIAAARMKEIAQSIQTNWHPKHADLSPESFPIWDYETYQKLPAHEKKLGLLLYAPIMHPDADQANLNNSSIYVITKGLNRILQKLQTTPHTDDSKQFFRDFNSLKELLQQNGLFGYPGETLFNSKEFVNDFVFEAENFYIPLLKATYEDFQVYGTKQNAILEFTDVEQRILTENKIDTRIHEDLLKWRDDYYASQIRLHGATPFDVPKPSKNIFLDNIYLSVKKYFRGDDRKVLHWGLDLSGGKTVQIELRDQNNLPVYKDEDIKQGINELYARVNKMGVSEVSIRREGNFISLDFPGSQNLSAHELIKSSSMYFHVVNEKFNDRNPILGQAANQFLQEIWNEAIVTGRKTAEELNQIAWRHMYGDSLDSEVPQPRSESARILHENGLRLSHPHQRNATNLFNDTISEIALHRGDDFTKWHGKTHPLLIVFRNFALEGSNLKNVHTGYEQSKGNFLAFEIKGKESLKSGEKINPRADLYSWTSQFSKDKINGTPKANYSNSEGWRMAVVLNGTVITAPTLTAPISEGGSIEGSFSQREVSQLESDLKAGSLSFTPHILSEKNVSPELGTKERNLGIVATYIALILVVACMIAYYRFGGFIASIALVVNLFIMWATLQNLDATLTLASIAGGILTLGMAVDANVLVFERIREEFAQSGRLASAVHIGYRKAFSAILDSNVTTIIAALVLLQFDSGPIKGLAITLIIGIVSSMFTALFMTRYFFSGWVLNPKNTQLKMSHFIKASKFDFLKHAKLAFIGSAVLILIGGYLFFQKQHTIFGMDFTGGYALTIELQPKEKTFDYRQAVEKALVTQGAQLKDFQVRQLTPSHHIRLFLSKNMQQAGKPFFGMPLENELLHPTYSYENNPRIDWVVSSLAKANLAPLPDTLHKLDQNWSEISGQLSTSMRNSALIGLAIATLGILLYITLRFEFKYAISATLCLVHDIAITLAMIALFNRFHLPVQIDLNTIAALMTIVGYSLNDTIIVFDRIREDLRLMRKASFKEIINHALNVTLSRTLMTSGTTMLVLLPLVFLGGSTIFAFSLVMIVGVIFGTLSSLFIAAPLLQFFHEQQERKEKPTIEVASLR